MYVAVVWQSRVRRDGLQTQSMVGIVGQDFLYGSVTVINNTENREGFVVIGNSSDFVVVPLGPQILRSAVHSGAHDRFGFCWQGEIAVRSGNLQLVAEIPPVAHRVESRQDEIEDGQKLLIRRTVVRQLVRQRLYGHSGHRGSLQEKGLGVKDRLPLADGAFLSSHAEFGLCGTPAFLAAASLSETGFVPKLTTFTDLESGVKGLFVRYGHTFFDPISGGLC